MEPENKEHTGRNPNGTYKPGFSGNPGGRPKNTLKAYLRRKIDLMSEEEMESFLSQIPRELQWQMAEGRPEQDLTSAGEKIQIPIYGGESISKHDSDKEDLPAEEAD